MRRYLIHGRVQGVGFRVWVREAARRLNVRGQVRNLSDGEVEVVAAGEPDAIREFTTLLRSGPTSARVTSLEESTTDAVPLEPFTILR